MSFEEMDLYRDNFGSFHETKKQAKLRLEIKRLRKDKADFVIYGILEKSGKEKSF